MTIDPNGATAWRTKAEVALKLFDDTDRRVKLLETGLREAYLALEATARHMPADAKPDVLPLAARLRTLVDG